MSGIQLVWSWNTFFLGDNKGDITLYEAIIGDIAEHVTIKQILKGYGNGEFGVGTGTNFKELEARKLARNERVSSQIIANNDNAINIDFSQQQQQQKHDNIDSDDGCSPPQKRKSSFDKTKKEKG